ncbi:hypothetical protein BCR35DRAFT_308092 [Leucosporidium creatinivorum]|uniref:Nucleotide-diphospho-sugar transferase n=1 Tax=Leucosporidium creatinivorum TaxID=106004 RepID=A0A1Y2ECI0_9BASI|nr:hypothetical protein BCR35DRAFT_308092 [Leucosporidium creatinivorum]
MAKPGKATRVRKALCVFLTLLALFLIGTVVVLSTVVSYFGVDWRDVITEPEMKLYERLALQASKAAGSDAAPSSGMQEVVAPLAPTEQPEKGEWVPTLDEEDTATVVDEFVGELVQRGLLNSSVPSASTPKPRIPKIIHQTWKTDTLPERWDNVRKQCMELHPDYEYKLWSDESSREFIAKEYPWFLTAFDGYPYPIQRADAIRYFVLHHFGGVYMDLDIGCKRNMDPLLYFQVILPATIPVGVSNDLMLSEKGHPFMDLVIHNLVTFNHQYGTNYPTVMFSTGPMFLSAQYGLWPKEDIEVGDRQVRILPRRWYGKNAPVTEMEDSYFDHFYGSSWHADDAGFITFLGKFGMGLMYIGFGIVILGVARLVWSKRSILKTSSQRQLGPIALPFHVGSDGLPFTRPGTPGAGSRPDSPVGSRSGTPSGPRLRQDSATGRGVLYYLPVWFLPPGDSGSRSPGPSSPTQGQGWSQYLPNLSFVEDDAEHRYHPVPNFSRPPSPSNNSILHAPGSMHDGAFDGTPLHSIQSPKPIKSHPPRDLEETASSPPPPSAPTSPNPPAYSSLKSWGSALFRTSPRASLVPLGANGNGGSGAISPSLSDAERGSSDLFVPSHAKSSSTSSSTAGQPPPRARSPLPQYQPPTSQSLASAGSDPEDEAWDEFDPSTAATAAEEDDLEGSGEESYPGGGAGVEEEVDRLLSEMEPDFEAKLARERRGEQ